MGNDISSLHIHPGNARSFKGGAGNESALFLDNLGGYYREAVGRKEELDVKADWLGKAVLAQADKMEDALELNHVTTKEVAMSVMGGPQKADAPKALAFGSILEKPTPKKPAGKVRAASARTANGYEAFSKPPRLPATIAEDTHGQGNGLPASKPLGVSAAAAASLQGASRAGTTPMRERGASARPLASRSSTDSMRPTTAQRAGSAVGGKKLGKAAAAAEARRAAQAEAELREQHWRVRVYRAKRRLYLYLRAYMAWTSVLKNKRKGYAEPLTIECLPLMLTTTLGDSHAQFGVYLKNIEQKLEAGAQHEAQDNLAGIAGKWKALAASRRFTTVDGQGAGPQASIDRKPSHNTFGKTSGVLHPSGNHTPSPPVDPPSFGGRRPKARNGAAAGQGGTTSATVHAALDSPQDGSLPRSASGRRQHVDPETLGAYGASRPMTASPRSIQGGGRKSLLDIVTSASSRGQGLLMSRRHRDAHADRSAIEKGGEAVSLQLLVNKANAHWVEKHMALGNTWARPNVVDAKSLQLAGVDMEMYENVCGNLLAQGKLALQLVYVGEEQVVSAAEGLTAEARIPACTTDLWDVLKVHYPHKVPAGSRITGLTLLDRRILQSLTSAEKQGGPGAVAQLVMLLCVDANVVPWVAEQAVLKRHWGLQEDQIIIVPIQRFPGMTWSADAHIFHVAYSLDVPYHSADSGYALLALNWPSHAFTAAHDPAAPPSASSSREPPVVRHYIAGSVLKHLAQHGVQYLYSSHLCDFEALHPQHPSPDPKLCGPAIYAMDTQGANMAMQVTMDPTNAQARHSNSVVLAPHAGAQFCFNVPMTDVHTTAARAAVQSVHKQQGHLHSCTSRYLFQVRPLMAVLTGPSSFHVKLQVKAPHAYLHLDMADVTSFLGIKCAAILAQAPTKGPEPQQTVFSKLWIRDSSSALVMQEAQTSFRTRAIKCLGHAAAPVSGAAVNKLNNIARNAPLPHKGGSAGTGSRILLLVKDNQISRHAYRLARQLIRMPGDLLVVMHIAPPRAAPLQTAALLASFSHVMTDAQTMRRMVDQGGSLVETVQQQVDEVQPDLLVMGTEHLVRADPKGTSGISAKVQGSLGASLSMQVTSLVLAVARTVTDVPLLVVKANSSGELFSHSEGAGEKASPPLRVMVEAQSVSAPLLHWLVPRMSPHRDHLILARPFGLDQANQVTNQTQRMLNTLSIEAAALGRNVRKVPMREGPGEGFLPLVVSENIDMLALIAPNAKVTPPHILDIVRTARTNVLVWRTGHRGGL